ncbi:MAG: 30S ribosomal protein S3, partial [Patescibacteria group bacterium]
EISRREWIAKGKLPLQTLRADIDYAESTAFCNYGTVGVKVWIYKGEIFNEK